MFLRDDQLDITGNHFSQLVAGNTLLKGEQVLNRNLVSFTEDLSPAILAACLGGQHK